MNKTNHLNNLLPLCEALLQADSDIVEILQYGSSVYAPDLARDIDLLVVTAVKKSPDVYLQSVADWPIPVDVNVRQPDEPLGNDIALSLGATSTVLFGNGLTIKEAKAVMQIPTYEQILQRISSIADQALSTAHNQTHEDSKDQWYRIAFNSLFEIARNAVMVYLNTEETRWGQLRRRLPEHFAEPFQRFINTLHIDYSYSGNYPRDRVDEEYQYWRAEVVQFIENLKGEI